MTASSAAQHRFTLADWDRKASVRSKPDCFELPADLDRQLLTQDWFPPAFLPYLAHPLIQGLGRATQQRLAANHLVYFLDYTTLLEHKIVNRAVETLVHGDLAMAVPRPMRTAALQLYTDEGYHALFSDTLAAQIAHWYGIDNRHRVPRRIRHLLALVQRTAPQQVPLAWFFIGFVSETIIAKELLAITRDSLIPCVYHMLREHLEDEARHSRYFCEVFGYTWEALAAARQPAAADLLLAIIQVFAQIDGQWLRESFASAGIDPATRTQVIEPLLQPQAWAQRARANATTTLATMKKYGFFEPAYNRQLFVDAGLIDG